MDVNHEPKKVLYCAFCEKSQHEVRKLIKGNGEGSFICDECISSCDNIILETLYPGRVVVRVSLPNSSEFNSAVYGALSEAVSDVFKDIDLRYELDLFDSSAAQYSDGRFALFTYEKMYGAGETADKEYTRISQELESALVKLSIAQEKFLNESEKAKSIKSEMQELKEEYLGFLREKNKIEREHSDLRAIVFLDITGFTQYTHENKLRTIAMLRGIVPALMLDRGAQQVNMWGDGIVATFQDANAAVDTAVRFLRHLSVEQLEVRIGIAWGRIRIAFNPAIGRPDIDGDAVNLAARIEPMAEAGEILLTKEFSELHIDKSLGEILPVTRHVKKAFGPHSEGQPIELLKLVVLKN